MGDEGENEVQVVIDYDIIDEQTGFKQAEYTIWKAFEEQVLLKPEDDRPDVEGWVDEYCEEAKFDRKRVKYVATMGIYAGRRDEFNQRSGSGKAIYATGDVYEGEFYEGKKHGEGHYVFKSKGMGEVDTLLSKMYKSKPEDQSNEVFVKGAAEFLKIGTTIVETALEFGFHPCYHGDYLRGMRVGEGIMKNKDGSVYKGDWKDNKRHGSGLYYYINGDVYSGQWDMGKKNGFGTYRFANGCEYRGEWVQGNFVEGQWIMADGKYYEGKFDKKNRPCDEEAVMHFPERNSSMVGVYKKGKWAPLNDLIECEEVPSDANWGN